MIISSIQHVPNAPLKGQRTLAQFYGQTLNKDVFVKTKTAPAQAVSFLGITHAFANNIFKNFNEAVEKIASDQGNKKIVGQPPQEWVQKIPEKNRSKQIPKLFKAFDIAVVKLGMLNKDIDKISKELTTSLRELNILNDEQSVYLKKIDWGGYGIAYSLNATGGAFENKYVIKTFYSSNQYNVPDRDLHGNLIEINRAMFWQKQVDKTADKPENVGKGSNRPRFFFGNVGRGYMLCQLVDGNSPFPKEIDLSDYGLKATDDENNHNRGYFFDYGGLKPVSVIAHNKTARNTYQQIKRTPENERVQKWHEIYDNDKVPNKKDILVGLAVAVKLLPEQNEQKSYFDKILKKHDSKQIREAISESVEAHTTTEGFDMLEGELSAEQIENLIFNIEDIEPSDRLAYVSRLVQVAQTEQVQNLVLLMDNIPESDRGQFIIEVLDNHPSVARMCVLKLDTISDADKPKVIAKLATGDDTRYQELLISKIEQLPENVQEVVEEALVKQDAIEPYLEAATVMMAI